MLQDEAFTKLCWTSTVFWNALEGVAAEHCEHAECCQEAGEHDASGAEVASNQHEDQSKKDSELKGPYPPAKSRMIDPFNNSYNDTISIRLHACFRFV